MTPTEKKLREMAEKILDENIHSLGFPTDEDYSKALKEFTKALVSVRNSTLDEVILMLDAHIYSGYGVGFKEGSVAYRFKERISQLKTPEGKGAKCKHKIDDTWNALCGEQKLQEASSSWENVTCKNCLRKKRKGAKA